MKVSELGGAQLDLWVARAQGYPDSYVDGLGNCILFCRPNDLFQPHRYEPSEDWSAAGSLIMRHHISMMYIGNAKEKEIGDPLGRTRNWAAFMPGLLQETGATPMIAACRLLVTAVFGNEVHEEDAIARKSDVKVMKELHIRLGSNNKSASKPSDEMA